MPTAPSSSMAAAAAAEAAPIPAAAPVAAATPVMVARRGEHRAVNRGIGVMAEMASAPFDRVLPRFSANSVTAAAGVAGSTRSLSFPANTVASGRVAAAQQQAVLPPPAACARSGKGVVPAVTPPPLSHHSIASAPACLAGHSAAATAVAADPEELPLPLPPPIPCALGDARRRHSALCTARVGYDASALRGSAVRATRAAAATAAAVTPGGTAALTAAPTTAAASAGASVAPASTEADLLGRQASSRLSPAPEQRWWNASIALQGGPVNAAATATAAAVAATAMIAAESIASAAATSMADVPPAPAVAGMADASRTAATNAAAMNHAPSAPAVAGDADNARPSCGSVGGCGGVKRRTAKRTLVKRKVTKHASCKVTAAIAPPPPRPVTPAPTSLLRPKKAVPVAGRATAASGAQASAPVESPPKVRKLSAVRSGAAVAAVKRLRPTRKVTAAGGGAATPADATSAWQATAAPEATLSGSPLDAASPSAGAAGVPGWRSAPAMPVMAAVRAAVKSAIRAKVPSPRGRKLSVGRGGGPGQSARPSSAASVPRPPFRPGGSFLLVAATPKNSTTSAAAAVASVVANAIARHRAPGVGGQQQPTKAAPATPLSRLRRRERPPAEDAVEDMLLRREETRQVEAGRWRAAERLQLRRERERAAAAAVAAGELGSRQGRALRRWRKLGTVPPAPAPPRTLKSAVLIGISGTADSDSGNVSWVAGKSGHVPMKEESDDGSIALVGQPLAAADLTMGAAVAAAEAADAGSATEGAAAV
ncbi:unnamed protein product [Phaeothamnion confervicola]